MSRFASPDEVVVVDVEMVEGEAECISVVLCPNFNRDAAQTGRLGNFGRVLIRAGQQEFLIALQVRKSGGDIGDQSGKDMANMR
ncbi:hypothetical protein D9M71_110130 [compost metagenome]